MAEVIASQEQMRQRRGYTEAADVATTSAAFEKHLRKVNEWLESKPYARTLRVHYHEALSRPEEVAQRVAAFLGMDLDLAAMAEQADASLYRNRGK